MRAPFSMKDVLFLNFFLPFRSSSFAIFSLLLLLKRGPSDRLLVKEFKRTLLSNATQSNRKKSNRDYFLIERALQRLPVIYLFLTRTRAREKRIRSIMGEGKEFGKRFTFESKLNCPATVFLVDKDTEDFREFHMKRVGTKEAETLRTGVELVDLDKNGEEKEKRFVTVVRTVPGIKLPMVVKPLLKGGHVEFVDTRSTSPNALDDFMKGKTKTHETMFRTKNNITKHAVVDGVISIIPITATTCKVVASGLCHVTLGSLGRLIENIIVNGIGKSYEQLPEICDEWLKHKRDVLKKGSAKKSAKVSKSKAKTEDNENDNDSESSFATASTEFNESAGSSQNQILDIDSFAAPLTPIFNSILSFSGFGSSSNRDEEEEEDELDGDLEEMKKDISFEVVEQSIDASNANGLGGKKKVVKVERSMKKSSSGFTCCFASPAVES